MAVVIYRYIAAYHFQDRFSEQANTPYPPQFIDKEDIAVWAQEAVEWQGKHRVIAGYPASSDPELHFLRYFKPNAHLTRAEAMGILVNMVSVIGQIAWPGTS